MTTGGQVWIYDLSSVAETRFDIFFSQFRKPYEIDMVSGEKHKLLIEFFALRDDAGSYIGCMECMCDVGDIMRLEGEKRLFD